MSAPDPVIERSVQRVMVCPGEVSAPLPPAPALPPDARISGNASAMDWLSAMLAWGKMLAQRIGDAGAACARAAVTNG